MKTILMSSYACEPNKGSEPGVGWNWAIEMSKDYFITVYTRTNNKEFIERELAKNPQENLTFLYYDLPKPILWLKKSKLLNTTLYYLLWQIAIGFSKRKEADKFDLIHHVTFNMFLCPGIWRPKRAKLLIGPLGGGACCPDSYLRLFGNKAYYQRFRNWCVKHWKWVPFVKGTMQRSDFILCANQDTQNLLDEAHAKKSDLHLETGINVPETSTIKTITNDLTQFIQIGSIEPRKGWQLSLQACHLLLQQGFSKFHLSFVGSGPEIEQAKQLSYTLKLCENVSFLGKKTLAETLNKLESSDVLLFPSVRDTSGNVVLEAMSRSKPSICLNHQGARQMTNDACAIRITPNSEAETISKLAESMLTLSESKELQEEMGNAGLEKIITSHTWDSKRQYMSQIYDKLLKK